MQFYMAVMFSDDSYERTSWDKSLQHCVEHPHLFYGQSETGVQTELLHKSSSHIQIQIWNQEPLSSLGVGSRAVGTVRLLSSNKTDTANLHLGSTSLLNIPL